MRRLGAGFLPLGTSSSLLHRLPSCFVIAVPLFLPTPPTLSLSSRAARPFTLFCVLCQHSLHCQTVRIRLSYGSKAGLVRAYERAIKLPSQIFFVFSNVWSLVSYGFVGQWRFLSLNFCVLFLFSSDLINTFPFIKFYPRIFASSFP